MRRTPLLLFLVLGLAMGQPGLAQSVHYAENCVTDVENATAIIPPSADPSLPNGSSLAPGDTIAILNGSGGCVGYGVWTGEEDGLAIAAAGSSAPSDTSSGLDADEPLLWSVFDESRGSVVDLGQEVLYASCDAIFFSTCQDDGTYADGAVFILEAFQKSGYAVTVVGDDGTDNDAGWRMLSLPAAEATRASLEDDLDFSVMPGSVVRRWQEGQWTTQDSSDPLPRGTGFIFYFFDSEANPIDSDGLQLDVDPGPENVTDDHKVEGLDRNEEWILLGNPFRGSFDLGALADGDLPAAGFQATVHVWDPNAEQYRLITQGTTGDDIAGWQGFFVQRSTLGEGQRTLTFGAGGHNTDGTESLIGSRSVRSPLAAQDPAPSDTERPRATDSGQSAEVPLQLAVVESTGDTISTDQAIYRIDRRATEGYDAYDAEALPPPSGDDGYATVTLPIVDDGDLIHRALGATSPPRADARLDRSIPLSVRGVGIGGTATLEWSPQPGSMVPDDWVLQLHDTQTDSTVDLRRESYTFALEDGTTLSRPSDARFRMRLQSDVPPVELGPFEGDATAEHVALRWETTSERDNAGFRVQRRGSPSSGWTNVGYVEGTGTTDKPQRYRFEDADLPYAADTLHYRLRAVDTEGSASLSDPIAVARSGVDALTLLGTYPNPASNRATVRYAIPSSPRADETARLALYDALGRRVRTIPVSGRAGRHEQQFRVSDLASGMYFLRLRFGGVVKSRKVTVVR